METATGEAIPPRNASQLDLRVLLEEAHVAQRRAGNAGVEDSLTLPSRLPAARIFHSHPGGAGLRPPHRQDAGQVYGADIDHQVEPVAQGTRELALIASQNLRRAAAIVGTTGPTWARVGGRHQCEAGRQDASTAGAADPKPALLQRLAQRLEAVAPELGEFVEDKDAPMGEGA